MTKKSKTKNLQLKKPLKQLTTVSDLQQPETTENPEEAPAPSLPYFEESVLIAYKTGQYIKCIKTIERILKVTPKEHASHYKILLAAANTMTGKNFKRSHNLLNEVLRLNPFNGYALYGKGVAFYFERKFDESLRFFDLAIDVGMKAAREMKIRAQVESKQVKVVLRKLNVEFEKENDEKLENLKKNEGDCYDLLDMSLEMDGAELGKGNVEKIGEEIVKEEQNGVKCEKNEGKCVKNSSKTEQNGGLLTKSENLKEDARNDESKEQGSQKLVEIDEKTKKNLKPDDDKEQKDPKLPETEKNTQKVAILETKNLEIQKLSIKNEVVEVDNSNTHEINQIEDNHKENQQNNLKILQNSTKSDENLDQSNKNVENLDLSDQKSENVVKNDLKAVTLIKNDQKAEENVESCLKLEESSVKLEQSSNHEAQDLNQSILSNYNQDSDKSDEKEQQISKKGSSKKKFSRISNRLSLNSSLNDSNVDSDGEKSRTLRSTRKSTKRDQKVTKNEKNLAKNPENLQVLTKSSQKLAEKSQNEQYSVQSFPKSAQNAQKSTKNLKNSSTIQQKVSNTSQKPSKSPLNSPESPKLAFCPQQFIEILPSATKNLDSSLDEDSADLKPTSSANSFAQQSFNKGLDLYMIGQLQRSLKYFQKSIKLEPDFEEADEMSTKAQEFIDLLDVVDINLKEKNFGAVIEICGEALDIDEENDVVNRKFYFQRGLAYFHLDDRDNSMKDYEEYERLGRKIEMM